MFKIKEKKLSIIFRPKKKSIKKKKFQELILESQIRDMIGNKIQMRIQIKKKENFISFLQ